MTHDDRLVRTRALEEARAALAKLRAENDALRARAGEPPAAYPERADGGSTPSPHSMHGLHP